MTSNRKITTYSGLHVDPLHPKPGDFRIGDIAHALSLICRGNGHVKSFFSVGQHCIYCAREAEARGLSARVILMALLHDASECYISDLPSPLKKGMLCYETVETRLLKTLFTDFLGSYPTEAEWNEVRKIDKAYLWYDMHELLEPIEGEKPDLHVIPDYTVRPFKEVEEEYLQIFRDWYPLIQPDTFAGIEILTL